MIKDDAVVIYLSLRQVSCKFVKIFNENTLYRVDVWINAKPGCFESLRTTWTAKWKTIFITVCCKNCATLEHFILRIANYQPFSAKIVFEIWKMSQVVHIYYAFWIIIYTVIFFKLLQYNNVIVILKNYDFIQFFSKVSFLRDKIYDKENVIKRFEVV